MFIAVVEIQLFDFLMQKQLIRVVLISCFKDNYGGVIII